MSHRMAARSAIPLTCACPSLPQIAAFRADAKFVWLLTVPDFQNDYCSVSPITAID